MPPVPLQVLDSSHGLNSNQIHSVAIDSRDRLWLAMPAGLACYDGGFVHHWDRERGLRCNGLRSVAAAADDSIWIGSDLGIDLLDSSGHPQPSVDAKSWHFGLCERVDLAGSSPWLATARGLVRLVHRAGDSGYIVDYSAPVGFINDLVRVGETRVLAASAELGLIETDGKAWWKYHCDELSGRQISCLALGYGQQVLVGTDSGLVIVNDVNRQVVAELRNTAEPSVDAIVVAHDRYWVAHGRLLIAYATTAGFGVLETFQAASPINDLVPDRLGNLWVATNNSGLAVVSCLRHSIQKIDLSEVGGVFSIKAGPERQHYIGGVGLFGAAVLPNDASTAQLEAPAGLPNTIVWDSHVDESGIWAATQKGLFRAESGQEFVQIFPQDEILGAPARVLLPRGDELWIGTLRGLARVHSGKSEAVNDEAGVPLGYTYALHLDSSAALWIATLGRGLWREQNGLRHIYGGPLSEDGNTYAVAVGPDGETIVLQDEKVILLNRDLSPRLVAELPPVAGWSAIWLSRQSVALGASDGLRILDVSTGRFTRLINALFPLPDWEFTNNRGLAMDSRGRLLCGVNGGLFRVDLNGLRSLLNPPECSLLDIVWDGVVATQEEGVYRLRPGRWRVRIRVFAAWHVAPHAVSYQFKLIGFDDTWSPPTDKPEIRYNSLPIGKYKVVVRAYSPLTGYGPEAELLNLHVSYPWWAMGWVSILEGMNALYENTVRSTYRNQELLSTNRALEQAIAERTESLEGANRELALLRDAYLGLSETDELTQLGNRRKFDSELSRALNLGRRLKIPVALLMLDVDHFKAVNDRYGHHVGDEYLRTVGKVLQSCVRIGEDVATRFGGEEFAIVLTNADTLGAPLTAERIRTLVEDLALPNIGAPTGYLTVSIGIAVALPEDPISAGQLMILADKALYSAKQAGRNRVVLANGLNQPTG